ncbi:signal peptidase I [Aestuariivirga sp.]|uniref:signal peptidase I n=1 Tax=Aestuariivirga sp. TaxID=2650926 RepID=UPI0039E41B68
MQKRDYVMAARPDARRKPDEGIWETVKVIIQALLIAFFVRTFLYQPFNIPSGSMYPTLKVGDYLFVSKLSYGYGKYSFNFSLGAFGHEVKCCSFIDFPGRIIFQSTPKRGDIAVFKKPSDTDVDYIKRVIGLPGDHIQMRDGVIFLNGVAVKKERIQDYVNPDPESEPYNTPTGSPVPQFMETLPEGVQYRVLDFRPDGALDNTPEFVVPPAHYFMMGDNRDNSSDSRDPYGGVGYVPIENFVGRADIIFFSISPEARLWEVWMWPFEIRWSRFFNIL